MESRSFQLLEFHKILDVLSGFAKSEPGAFSCTRLPVLSDSAQIQKKAALFNQTLEWLDQTQFKLPWFPSLEGLFQYLDSGRGQLDQDALFALKNVLDILNTLKQSLSDFEEKGWDALGHALFDTPWPQKVLSAIGRCLDNEGRLKDDSSPDLLAIRQEIRSIHTRCSKRVKDFVLKEGISNYLQDDFMTISSDRYVLPLKVNFKKRLDGIIHDYSQTGETCYFEPMFLVETNNRLQELKREEREEENKVLKYLTDLVVQEREQIESGYHNLVDMDVLMAKIALAGEYNGRVVDVMPGPATLREARHPLLALQEEQVQSLDIEYLEDIRALIVSGGNAGGKTVSLKTLGLIALMAYAGLPVPVAAGSRIPLWKEIFVIMGDEQSLEENVSTFTAQIHYLKRAWDHVDADSLFILDEFGAGTDPTQGAALAQAVVDGLMEKQATVIAATHFPALKAYAVATAGVRAASVLFDPATKKPLFKLAYDQVGASIALDVARDNGLPESVLEKAESYLLLDGSDTSAVLDRLNALAVQREQELEQLKAKEEKLKKKYDKLTVEFERKRKKLLSDLQAQSQRIVRQWKEDKVSRKQAQKELAGMRAKLSEGATAAPETPTFSFSDIRPGMRVQYVAWGKSGVVSEINTRKKQAKVEINGVAMWVKAQHLGPASDQKQQNTGHSLQATPGDGKTLELDIRGRRADEAIAELERFLDNALLQGAGSVEIIHGKGTGALRREVHNFLKSYPAIDGFTLANEDRGGDGMTQVTLK